MPNQQGRIYSFSANFVSLAPATLIETYEYDYLGNRTAKTSNDVRTEYTTDLSTGYSQVLKATTGSDSVYYTRGFELISRREGSSASYYIYDGSLSVRALTNETGTITDTLVFDAFGNETAKTGSTDNSYGFQGEEKDETGLYYLRARYMDPSTGTFTSMDTYGGSLSDPMSLHKYMFANSNPVMYSDPSGHFCLAEMDAAMAIDNILNAGYISGYLYIIDASITDPNLEHHDMFGFLGAIGLGMFLAGLNLALVSSVTGLLILAVIDTILGVAGAIKGAYDFINGHPIYGAFEIFSSIFLTIFGWKNYNNARNATNAAGEAGGRNVNREYGNGKGTLESNNQKSKEGAEKYSDYPWYENQTDANRKSGRSRNNISPNSNATEDHVVYKKNPATGEITNYTVYKTNPRNPTGFDEVIRYDGIGDQHYNPVTMEELMPHVHDKTAPGKVRAPYLDEIP